jgi:two-component system, OmpR family, alkaline phosphatase synthesis response regulator PhoP
MIPHEASDDLAIPKLVGKRHMSKTSILIVEDELEIAELVRFHAEREGFDGRIVQSGRVALTTIESNPPDLVLLDLMLPDVDGLEVCRRLKWQPQTRNIPILIVSAKGDEADIVAGIELGADDYVTKPFSPKVLMARIKNVLRRYGSEQNASSLADSASLSNSLTLADGALVIDPDRHTVSVNGRPIDLTVTEFGIMQYLATRPGFVRTRDQIISAVHGDSAVLSSRTVDVHVTALRRKLGDLGAMIETVRGVGYRLSDLARVPDE